MANVVFMVLTSIVFIGFFVTGLSTMLADWGMKAVEMNSMVGFEAFFYSNLIFVVTVFFFMMLFGAAYFGGSA